ncbi:MAG: carboxypeptidase-like regulatory domain-containing protein [Candidatus Diapherotrites archaeon]|nr:carboxypeptidase-like regulatory domain-containing protein [Candidatus Diapherotrites archaeon]
MDFVGALKDFYYSLEDRYYSALDWIEAKGVPIYKVIDPIDEVIPSFAVFCLVILLLFLGIFWLLFFSSPQYSITVKVLELSSKNPVSGVRVDYNYGIEGAAAMLSGNSVTGPDGTFTIEKLSGNLNFAFFVKKEGFLDYKSPSPEKITIDTSTIILKLEKKQVILPLAEKKIIVRDASLPRKPRIDNQKIEASFSCSSGKSILSKTKDALSTTDIVVTPTELNGCGAIEASVEILGYLPVTKPLVDDLTFFDMNPEPPQKGKLKVFVRDKATNALLGNFALTLYKNDRTTPKQTGRTDEAGSFVFEETPGNYFVSAADDINRAFDSNETSLIAVEVGKTAEATILLSRIPPSDEKNLKIQVLDANNLLPLSGASVYYSLAGSFQASPMITNEEGKVVIGGARNGKLYYARISLAGFVSKTLQVLPRSPTDANFTRVLLFKATETPRNYGNIHVFVKSEVERNGTQGLVSDALVKLYNTSADGGMFVPWISRTDDKGFTNFGNENFESGDYIAYAEKTYTLNSQSVDANGLAGPDGLELGQVLDLNVTLSLGIANLKVKVVDKAGVPVSDANVFFYESISADTFDVNAKFTARTNAAGETTTPAYFRVDKKVKILVTKGNFLPYTQIVSRLYRSDAAHPTLVNVVLQNPADNPEFNITLRRELFPEGCVIVSGDTKPAQIAVNQEKVYGLIFDIVVPESAGQSNVTAHFRSGLNSIPNATGLNMDIKSGLPPNYFPVLSANYPDQNGTVDGILYFAKQVNFSTGNLATGSTSICVNVRVKKLQNPSQPAAKIRLDFYYNAKSDSKNLQERSDYFTLGELFCRTDCPKFEYELAVCRASPSGDGTCEPDSTAYLTPKSNDAFDLNYNQNYNFLYKITNRSGRNLSSPPDIDANFTTDNQALDFGTPPEKTFAENIVPNSLGGLSVLANETSTPQLSVQIKGVSKTNTKLLLVLKPLDETMSDTNTFVYFDINASRYSVSVPAFLTASAANQQFQIIVSDAITGSRVQNASIKMKVADNPILNSFGDNDPNMPQPKTDSTGVASITLSNGYDTGKFLVVQVDQMPGYEASAIYNIQFSNVPGLLADELSCVQFIENSNPCSFDASKMCLDSKTGKTGTFKVKNNNCASSIILQLRNGFDAGNGERVRLSITPAANPTNPTISVGTIAVDASSSIITVSLDGRIPDGISGQFPIYPEIKYAANGAWKQGREFIVYADYPQYPNTCFAAGKTDFDLSTATDDENAVDNYCYISPNTDPNVPVFSISEDPKLLAFIGSLGDAAGIPVTFDWHIRADVLEYTKVPARTFAPGRYYFSVKAESATNNFETFDDYITAPLPTDPDPHIYERVTAVNEIKFKTYVSDDVNIALVTDPAIKIKFKDGTEKTINCITESVGIPPVTRCKMDKEVKNPCTQSDGRQVIAGSCTLGSFDLDLSGLSALDKNSIDTITAKIMNPHSDSYVYYDINGLIAQGSYVSEWNHFSIDFPNGSPQGQAIPGRQLQTTLGEMAYGIESIKNFPGSPYAGGAIMDVNFTVIASDPKVDTWIRGNDAGDKLYAFASYYGAARSLQIIGTAPNQAQRIPLTLHNVSWTGEGYSVLSVDDYVLKRNGRD